MSFINVLYQIVWVDIAVVDVFCLRGHIQETQCRIDNYHYLLMSHIVCVPQIKTAPQCQIEHTQIGKIGKKKKNGVQQNDFH